MIPLAINQGKWGTSPRYDSRAIHRSSGGSIQQAGSAPAWGKPPTHGTTQHTRRPSMRGKAGGRQVYRLAVELSTSLFGDPLRPSSYHGQNRSLGDKVRTRTSNLPIIGQQPVRTPPPRRASWPAESVKKTVPLDPPRLPRQPTACRKSLISSSTVPLFARCAMKNP